VANPVADWGAIVVETDIDRSMIKQLMRWMPTYLTHTELARDLPAYLLARPNLESYQNALEDDTFPDGRLPAIVVQTAQMEGEPEPRLVDTDVAYSAIMRSNVSVVVRGRTPPETREVAALFGGAVRAILVQQQTDIGLVRLTGTMVVPYPDATGEGRYLAAAVNQFTVQVDAFLTGDGPIDPMVGDPDYPPPDPVGNPDQPYDPLAVVRTVTTQVIARS
jgi:hypothetical protein